MVDRIFQQEIFRDYNPPRWWHHHGFKLALEKGESDRNRVIIRSKAAELVVMRAESLEPIFSVNWTIAQSGGVEIPGRILMDEETLKRAFGLPIEPVEVGPLSRGSTRRNQISSAVLGKYVRYNQFLNIPNQGTGHDQDPNISLLIDKEIQLAVSRIVGQKALIP